MEERLLQLFMQPNKQLQKEAWKNFFALNGIQS